jgi:hypothetical protein
MKQRRIDEAPTLCPSLKHFFMAGTLRSHLAPARLPGWFTTLEFLTLDDDAIRETWQRHREPLIAEAAAAGFVPGGCIWFESEMPPPADVDNCDVYILPPDARRTAWSAAFCRTHEY